MSCTIDSRAARFFNIWRQMQRGELVRQLKCLFQPEAGSRLTGSEIDVILALARRPGGCGMGHLTAMVDTDPGNLTRTISQLLAKNCIRRLESRPTGRERLVALTTAGREVAVRQFALRTAIFETAFANLTMERQEQLLDDLEAALEGMRSLARQADMDTKVSELAM